MPPKLPSAPSRTAHWRGLVPCGLLRVRRAATTAHVRAHAVGQVEVVQLLAERGADLNVKETSGVTPRAARDDRVAERGGDGGAGDRLHGCGADHGADHGAAGQQIRGSVIALVKAVG